LKCCICSCSFGGVEFECLYITEELITSALCQAGIATDDGGFRFYNNDDVYLLYGRKRGTIDTNDGGSNDLEMNCQFENELSVGEDSLS
jgi:hypothetical protein